MAHKQHHGTRRAPAAPLVPDRAALSTNGATPDQTPLFRGVQQFAASLIGRTEASAYAKWPRFIKAEPWRTFRLGLQPLTQAKAALPAWSAHAHAALRQLAQ